MKEELENIVKAFINDYEEWNTFAFKNSETSNNTIDDPTFIKYKAMIEKYCPPNKKFQGLSYSSVSSHSLITEEITSTEIDGENAIVKTKQTDSSGYPSFYEYEFINLNGKWYINELYYNDGQKYESL